MGPPTSSSKLYNEPCQPAPRSRPRGFLPMSFATPRPCTPSIRSRNTSDCSLTWPRELGHHPYVYPGRSEDKRAGARETATSGGRVFPFQARRRPFGVPIGPSDYAEYNQHSVAAPLPLSRSTRHNPGLGIKPVNKHPCIQCPPTSRQFRVRMVSSGCSVLSRTRKAPSGRVCQFSCEN